MCREDATYGVLTGQVGVHGNVILLTVVRVAAGSCAVHGVRPGGQWKPGGADGRGGRHPHRPQPRALSSLPRREGLRGHVPPGNMQACNQLLATFITVYFTADVQTHS